MWLSDFNNEHKFHISQTDNIIRFNMIVQVDKQFMVTKDRAMHINYVRLENRMRDTCSSDLLVPEKKSKMIIISFVSEFDVVTIFMSSCPILLNV